MWTEICYGAEEPETLPFFRQWFCHFCIVALYANETDGGGTQALPAVTRLSDSLNIVSACTVLFKAMACGMWHMHVYEECSWTRWIGSVLSLKRRLRDTLSTLWSGSYLHQMPLIPDMFYCMTDSDLTWSIYCMTKRWPLSWSFARSDIEQNLSFLRPAFTVELSRCFYPPVYALSFLSCCFHPFIWLLLPPSFGCFSMKRHSFTVVSAVTIVHSNSIPLIKCYHH